MEQGVTVLNYFIQKTLDCNYLVLLNVKKCFFLDFKDKNARKCVQF